MDPEAMRQQVADFVAALHHAYLTQANLLAPGERAALPLASGGAPITVAVAAARQLHVLATREPLPAPRGPEVELSGEDSGVTWTVRFYDASLLPELGVLSSADGSEDDPHAVRRVLGLAEVLYHVSVSPGGGLGAHHAQHAGVALANQHAAAMRDAQSLRRAFPGQEAIAEEFVIADRLGLAHAARLLAAELAGGRLDDAALSGDAAALRKALLGLARPGGRR